MKSNKIVLVLIAMVAVLASACATRPPAVSAPPACDLSTKEYSDTEAWWSAGDSIFAGEGFHEGAPFWMNGVFDVSYPGDTLVKVPAQPTVRERLQIAMCDRGIPHSVVIHAGGADMFARKVWNPTLWGDMPALVQYTDEIQHINTWLYGLGVDRVVWSTITPMASNAYHSATNGSKNYINSWLRTSGVDVVDCDSYLADESGWLMPGYELGGLDGVHLNEGGAVAHATCLVDGINDPNLTLKEG